MPYIKKAELETIKRKHRTEKQNLSRTIKTLSKRIDQLLEEKTEKFSEHDIDSLNGAIIKANQLEDAVRKAEVAERNRLICQAENEHLEEELSKKDGVISALKAEISDRDSKLQKAIGYIDCLSHKPFTIEGQSE